MPTKLRETCPCGTAFLIDTDNDVLALAELKKFRTEHKEHVKPLVQTVYPWIHNRAGRVKAEAQRVGKEFDNFVDRVVSGKES